MNSIKVYVIALYIRLSAEDSKVGSFSIENQKHTLHQYAETIAATGNTEILEFVDNGYSGTNFERPAVQELLDMVRDGKIHCIIVKDFTRFGRNSIEVGYFMERVFPLYGIRFISINDEFDSDTLHGDTGGINVAFKYLISEFYSRDLSIKYKSAKYAKFRRGEYQSKICPYGYRKSSDGRMEPDEETAPNVRLIFELAAAGLNNSQIMNELCTRRIPTPAEHRAAKGQNQHNVSRCCGIWVRSTLIRLLQDERYMGTYVIGKREVIEVGGHRSRQKDESEWIKIPNHHPPIVSKELFEQAQENQLHFKCVKKNKRTYLLREKVFCGCCQHAMHRTPYKTPVFMCRYTIADKAAPCNRLKITESEIEAMLYDILSKQAQIILNMDNLIPANLSDAPLTEHSECSNQIEIYLERKRMLYEQLLLHEIDLAGYKKQKATFDVELDRLRQLQTALAAQIAQMQMDEKTKNTRAELVQEIAGANGLTAGLVDKLIDRVYIHPDNQVDVIWKIKDFCMEG